MTIYDERGFLTDLIAQFNITLS